MKPNSSLPVLYSLRNCPYAMRARIAIYYAKQTVALRDLVLTDKPDEMIAVSPKGTVPVLVTELDTGEPRVIEESLEVMLWALDKSDPDNLLHSDTPDLLPEMLSLISTFDDEFKQCFDKYQCAKRYHETSLASDRAACEKYIADLEQRLQLTEFLMSDKNSLADIALLPFIRKFSKVERQWYLHSPYPKLRAWLNNYLQSRMFSKVMTQYPLWLENKAVITFGDDR
ncbi:MULTISPECIES: glutathione S-transferase [unclassified Colwellia]|jgi:glutathione S-transferase|uniref:glutathione S-transferase n=1 Tax=unclassified Colwellia TaxID=196834 RepID=UPI0015F43994|nr:MULTISPECIES: glutathione S-transferase [unclassified Colwellia]MBA6336111.1 glutathione S-transferase [Colwellia sp. BRX8-7]MBA6349012.1 glutathione S-transferase [Colwellia sp. BRX8-9]MBA6351973.1 glutathione S-transferase [Colwellia sp. BRX9-1]MBA6371737.1 glutathione S-transferase [Colwellia sp. BRX8-4]MBA6379792.1 glutathione S-transferase [Colwellia sp. BRX10-7]